MLSKPDIPCRENWENLWPCTGKMSTMQAQWNNYICTYLIVGIQLLGSSNFIAIVQTIAPVPMLWYNIVSTTAY